MIEKGLPTFQKLHPNNDHPVAVYNKQNDLDISLKQVEKLICFLLDYKKVKTDELNVHFVDTKTICSLHSEYFNDPTTTDCITFPMNAPDMSRQEAGGHHILGEIFVCPQTGVRYDPAHPYDEVSLYIVHGFLHLLGYDDIEEADEREMRNGEDELLALLKQEGLLLTQPDDIEVTIASTH